MAEVMCPTVGPWVLTGHLVRLELDRVSRDLHPDQLLGHATGLDSPQGITADVIARLTLVHQSLEPHLVHVTCGSR